MESVVADKPDRNLSTKLGPLAVERMARREAIASAIELIAWIWVVWRC